MRTARTPPSPATVPRFLLWNNLPHERTAQEGKWGNPDRRSSNFDPVSIKLRPEYRAGPRSHPLNRGSQPPHQLPGIRGHHPEASDRSCPWPLHGHRKRWRDSHLRMATSGQSWPLVLYIPPVSTSRPTPPPTARPHGPAGPPPGTAHPRRRPGAGRPGPTSDVPTGPARRQHGSPHGHAGLLWHALTAGNPPFPRLAPARPSPPPHIHLPGPSPRGAPTAQADRTARFRPLPAVKSPNAPSGSRHPQPTTDGGGAQQIPSPSNHQEITKR